MSTAILAHGAGAEHADGMLLGLPTYMYGVIAAVVFAVLLAALGWGLWVVRLTPSTMAT